MHLRKIQKTLLVFSYSIYPKIWMIKAQDQQDQLVVQLKNPDPQES